MPNVSVTRSGAVYLDPLPGLQWSTYHLLIVPLVLPT